MLAYLIRMRRGDRLLVTCLLPSTLLLVEWANRILRISGAHVVLHGEVEGLFDPAPQNSLSFGYWVSRWIRLRKPGSAIRLVVLDDFIRERLLAAFPENIAAADVAVLHHPILPVVRPGPVAGGPPTACFIGYRTKFKGFDQFVKLAKDHPTCRFLAIGGGKVEDMSAKDVQPSRSDQGYLSAIAGCDVAMFPYVSGYTCSLSAAALDALATGVHIIATDRPFFQSAALSFGSEFITVCSSTEDASKLLHDPAVWTRSRHRDQRLEQLSRSKYGLNAVRCAFETLAAV